MLPLLGLATVVVLLAVIMSRRMSPLVALIAVPTCAALAAGFGLKTGTFILAGIQQTASFAAMFLFAILYFGVMSDAGLLDPIVDGILRAVGTRPRRIVLGATLLALLVHLDGSGAVTFLVTIPAMLPLFERLRMDKRILACVTSMAAGVNFLPWTGPTARASAALHVTATDLFHPLIPVQIVGLTFVFAVAFWLGTREERRQGQPDLEGGTREDERRRLVAPQRVGHETAPIDEVARDADVIGGVLGLREDDLGGEPRPDGEGDEEDQTGRQPRFAAGHGAASAVVRVHKLRSGPGQTG